MPLPADPRDPSPCDGCPHDLARRSFLQGIGFLSLAALTGLGAPLHDALALTPRALRAVGRLGGNPAYPIPAQDGVQIDRDQEVILVRWQNAVYAFNLSCPHQRTALRWNQGADQFQCPKHHSKYRPDGVFVSGRATRGMDRFSVVRQGDQVVVDVGAMHKQDADTAGWEAAVLRL
ncbi:MAG TPA: Rieske (2Fe-2S) protein [Gemmatimonadales bacterium]|jgi:nitrite reductase/ring-hydroxylating ferredoxin subunit|nr:Rieske (2Fe-2S) protein [Gemmatimonadales bacterium]